MSPQVLLSWPLTIEVVPMSVPYQINPDYHCFWWYPWWINQVFFSLFTREGALHILHRLNSSSIPCAIFLSSNFHHIDCGPLRITDPTSFDSFGTTIPSQALRPIFINFCFVFYHFIAFFGPHMWGTYPHRVSGDGWYLDGWPPCYPHLLTPRWLGPSSKSQ